MRMATAGNRSSLADHVAHLFPARPLKTPRAGLGLRHVPAENRPRLGHRGRATPVVPDAKGNVRARNQVAHLPRLGQRGRQRLLREHRLARGNRRLINRDAEMFGGGDHHQPYFRIGHRGAIIVSRLHPRILGFQLPENLLVPVATGVQPRLRTGQDVRNVLGPGQHAAPDHRHVQRLARGIRAHGRAASDWVTSPALFARISSR